VSTRLRGLVRKELVRPDRPQLPGEDAFRFRHLLIRDAAYDALPKAVRAELHARFAFWLEQRGRDLVELDEIMGYHLEQAHRYERELGRPVDSSLADAARQRLTAATQRALTREDYAAAATLAERALALVPAGQVDGPLELDRNEAVAFSGQIDAHRSLSQASLERARAAHDRAAELAIHINMETWETVVSPRGAIDRLDALVDETLPELEELGDDYGLYNAYFARGWIAGWRGHGAEQIAAFERALTHARRHPERWDTQSMLGFLGEVQLYSPKPANEILAWLDEFGSDRRTNFRLMRAAVLVMLGRVDDGLDLLEAERTSLREQGRLADIGFTGQLMSFIAVRAANLELADQILDEACRYLEAYGGRGGLSTSAARRAAVLAHLGRIDEAEAWATKATDIGASDDVMTHIYAQRALARVWTRRGEHRAAEQHAREAIKLVLNTDFLDEQADAYLDLAEVYERAGRHADAVEALRSATALYDAKGDITGATQARMRLDAVSK